MRWFGLCLLLGSVVLVTGCTKKGGDTNSVSGKVTLDGKAVAGTVVFFYPSDNKEMGTPIGADGGYSMPNPSAGQVKVLVKGMAGVAPGPVTKGAPPPGVGELPKIPGQSEGVAPPAKYGSANTTDLTYEVKPGKQTYNIELKAK